jgi:hypothetical protein
MSEHNELVKAAQSTIRKMEIWGVRRGKTITKTKEWVITLEVEARRAPAPPAGVAGAAKVVAHDNRKARR